MNIGQIKVWAWATAAVLTIGLSWYVYDFVRKLPDLERPPEGKAIRETLEGVSPLRVQSDKTLTYEVAKRVIGQVDWTGAPPPLVPVASVDTRPTEKPLIPVSKLVKIMSIACDVSDAPSSFAQVRYLPDASVGIATAVLHVGDPLARERPEIVVSAIEPGLVRFKFTDEGRAEESLSCPEFDAKSEIVVIGDDGEVMMPKTGLFIPRTAETFVPGNTIKIARDRYRLGTEDVKRFGDDYATILGNEVQTAQHRDQKTGKYDGIEIKSVLPGSIAERHGAQEGDVVKSINGHPVTTTNEAISFVKTNKDKYTSWEVVIENRGKTRTVTYESGGH